MLSTTYQLTMRSGPTPGKTFPLEKEELVIGRDLSNEIVINDAGMRTWCCKAWALSWRIWAPPMVPR
jgi:hypothetical protein